MRCFQTMILTTCVAVVVAAGPEESRAQHTDVLTLQVNGQLVTGRSDCGDSNCTTGQWTLGVRVYPREFDRDFLVNNPGFNAPDRRRYFRPEVRHCPPTLTWIGIFGQCK